MGEKKIKMGNLVGSKAEFLRTFMFIFCFIFILLLTYIVGSLLYTKDSFIAQEGENRINPDEYFKDCQILEKECLDIDCRYYTRCGDGNFKACRIYDCDKDYGVYTEDMNGVQKTDKKPKPNSDAIMAQKDACSGTMEILSDQCVDNKEKIKVKITPAGECEIGGFTVAFDGIGNKFNTFTDLGDNTYEITAISCGKLSKVVPATPDGISLQF